MRLGHSRLDFPKHARKNAKEVLRRLGDHDLDQFHSPEAWADRPGCHTVPFLAVAFEKVDALSTEEPTTAVALARGLVTLAPQISILAGDRLQFQSEAERQEFYYLATSVLVSALAYAGRFEDAIAQSESLEPVLSSEVGSKYLCAEVKRRHTLILVEKQELQLAVDFLTEAEGLFTELNLLDLAALCILRRGNVLHLVRKGAGAPDYAESIWISALARRERKLTRDRADRVTCAALGNLARDLRDSPLVDRKEILRYVRGVKDRNRKLSRTRASVCLIEGMLAASASAYREALRLVWHAMGMFASLNAYSSVATCISEYLTITDKYEPELLEDRISDCSQFLKEECEPDKVAWIMRWLVADVTRERISALLEEALARSSRGCPARVAMSSSPLGD